MDGYWRVCFSDLLGPIQVNVDQEVSRGRIAESLLENEIYKGAIETLRTAIISQWESCPIRDTEGQHELKLMLKLLNDLQANIKTVMHTGQMAKVQIERDKGMLRKVVGF